MPPEVSNALVGAIVATITAMAAAAALLPPYIKRQMDIRQKAQEAKLLDEQKKSDDALAEAKQAREAEVEQRKQFSRLIDTLINERTGVDAQQEVMVKALTNSVTVQGRQMEILDTVAKELRANTNVTTEGVKTISELSDEINILLDTGSKPMQNLSKQIAELGLNIASVVTGQQGVTQKVDFIHDQLNKIIELINALEIMKLVAEAKLEDARKITGELPATN